MKTNAFKMAQAQFDYVAQMMSLDPQTAELLRWPMYELKVGIPVIMDDGSLRLFFGYRVQHNNALGPFKGGLRFHPSETLDTARALAMWMTWKTAVLDLPLGGAKGGITVDSTSLSVNEQERLVRGYIRRIYKIIGEDVDVPAPDVGTTPRMMGWIVDEYSSLVGRHVPGVVTGKSLEYGGGLGRTHATGYGVVYTIREAMKYLKMDSTSSVAAIQGFGNVSQYAAIAFTELLGGTVACVSYWDREDRTAYTVCHPKGVNPRFLQSITDLYGTIDKNAAIAQGYVIEDADSWITKDADVLIPGALEGQINAETVQKMSDRVKLIAEGANGPTTPEADQVLKNRGIYLIPDSLCNGGGMVASYLELVQSKNGFWWDLDNFLYWLERKITQAFYNVHDLALKEDVYTRDAAYIYAIGKVVRAMEERGWI